jgi:hypothetical protein
MSHFQVTFVTFFQCDVLHRKNVKRAVTNNYTVMNHILFCDATLLCVWWWIPYLNVNNHIPKCKKITFHNEVFITFPCVTKHLLKCALLSPFFMCCSHLSNGVMSHFVVIHLLYTMLPVLFNSPITIVLYYYYGTLLLNCSTPHSHCHYPAGPMHCPQVHSWL